MVRTGRSIVPGAPLGPGSGTGKVRRITFEDGEPQPPETMASDLAFPDGIGVFVPGRREHLRSGA
jgi:hypothetical protein